MKGQEIHDYTLTMLARCEASPTVRGLDVSPNELVPKIRRKNWRTFSPPRDKGPIAMTPRKLFPLDPYDFEESIQSRFDQPGWEVPTTPGFPLVGDPLTGMSQFDLDDFVRGIYHPSNRDGTRPESPPSYAPSIVAGILQTPALHKVWMSPSGDYTPHTKMFINGFDINSSPCPPAKSPSPVSRSQEDDTSNNQEASLPAAPLLSPFAGVSKNDSPVFKMDVDIEPTPALCDVFGNSPEPPAGATNLPSTPNAEDRRALNASTSSVDSGYFSVAGGSAGRLGALASTSGSAPQTRRAVRPNLSRGRSVSNAGASSSATASGSSSGHKTASATVGLMDAILDKRTRRRKHSHSEHRGAATATRGEGDVGVTDFGSPFKLGKKTSRREFLYSLDGDCEMQDAQPRKRRKTISGMD